MIVYQRTANVARGKMADAIGFAHEIATVFEDTTGVALAVMVPVGGMPFQIVWQTEYDDLAAVDVAFAKMAGSETYQAASLKGAQLFIEGSIRDEIWRTI